MAIAGGPAGGGPGRTLISPTPFMLAPLASIGGLPGVVPGVPGVPGGGAPGGLLGIPLIQFIECLLLARKQPI